MDSAVAAEAKRSELTAILIFIKVTEESCALIKLLLRLLQRRKSGIEFSGPLLCRGIR
jgi:hypothetical protein